VGHWESLPRGIFWARFIEWGGGRPMVEGARSFVVPDRDRFFATLIHFAASCSIGYKETIPPPLAVATVVIRLR
jgi:hypothetical protein